MITNPHVIAYARLSQDTDTSTSISRQWESMETYAAAQGWTIAERFEDVDVSGYKTGIRRPARDAFTAAMPRADVALFYRVDRVARSLLDFAAIMREAETHKVALVSATESIDTSTPMGRAMLQIVAIFAELESRTISARVTSSIDYLRRNGRRAGGQVPYGWRNVPNPDGAGNVLALDPERAPIVREAAERVMAGDSLRSIAADFTARGIPTPQVGGRVAWRGDTLNLLLRRHVMAGLTVHRGQAVRGADGMPLVNESTALLSRSAWDALVEELDGRAAPAGRRSRNRPLLHGLLMCDTCAERLYIHRVSNPKFADRYVCHNRDCKAPVAISAARVQEYAVDAALEAAGDLRVVEMTTGVQTTPDTDHAAIVAAIADVTAHMGDDDADVVALVRTLTDLKARRATLRDAAPVEFTTARDTGDTFGDLYGRAVDDDERRELLAAVLARVVVRKGTPGHRGLDPARLLVEWAVDPDAADWHVSWVGRDLVQRVAHPR